MDKTKKVSKPRQANEKKLQIFLAKFKKDGSKHN